MRNAQPTLQEQGHKKQEPSYLPQEIRNRSNRLTNQKYASLGFVADPRPPLIRDGQFPMYATAEPLANCICEHLALVEVDLKCLTAGKEVGPGEAAY